MYFPSLYSHLKQKANLSTRSSLNLNNKLNGIERYQDAFAVSKINQSLLYAVPPAIVSDSIDGHEPRIKRLRREEKLLHFLKFKKKVYFIRHNLSGETSINFKIPSSSTNKQQTNFIYRKPKTKNINTAKISQK